MEKTDYLNMRTTNINFRVSPLLKSALIEKGAKMGVNLSDYIMHILTKETSGNKETCTECQALKGQMVEVRSELQKYEDLAEPFRHMLDEPVEVGDKSYNLKTTYHIFWLMAQTFKTKPS